MCNSEGTPEMNLGVIIALDIGGTTVKSVLCDFEGRLLSNIDYTPIDSRGSRSTILNVFSKIVIDLLAKADEMGSQPSGLVLAFPGPFDYERGICLIKGVGKYEALYGIDIKSFFRDEVLANRIPVFFDADSWAFTRGQCLEGAARGAKRVIGLTIGTGLGSAFVEDGRIIENERGVPPYGWIGFLPCGKGILDETDLACHAAHAIAAMGHAGNLYIGVHDVFGSVFRGWRRSGRHTLVAFAACSEKSMTMRGVCAWNMRYFTPAMSNIRRAARLLSVSRESVIRRS
ncbi:MAG TPA: ROK family protein [Mesotoga infera]|nr:ROK family protein [Mesotoga infera]